MVAGYLPFTNKEINCFDLAEMNTFFSDADRKSLKKIQTSNEFIGSIVEADLIFNLDLNSELLIDKTNDECDSGNTSEDKKINKKNIVIDNIDMNRIYINFMRNYVNDTLNNMEYFAMHFNHNTADESVVYQSLHNSYIEIVEKLYYFIAITNRNPSNRYYTNVIWLYKLWKQKMKNQEISRQESVCMIEEHGNRVSKLG